MTKTQDILALAKEHKALNQLSITLDGKIMALRSLQPEEQKLFDLAGLEKEQKITDKNSLKIWNQMLKTQPQTGKEAFGFLHAHITIIGVPGDWYSDDERKPLLPNMARILAISEAEAKEVKDLFIYGPE